jgi:hypothetical protein
MEKPEDSIERKLKELELNLTDGAEKQSPTVVEISKRELSNTQSDSTQAEIYKFVGISLLVIGIFLFLNHVRVGTAFFDYFGHGRMGFGFTIIPLLIGLGIFFYDWKNKIGWVVLAASLALIIFGVFSQLVMTFPSLSLLGFIIMFLPFAAGAAFLIKGIKGDSTK